MAFCLIWSRAKAFYAYLAIITRKKQVGFLVGFFKWVLGEKTRWVFLGRVGFFKR